MCLCVDSSACTGFGTYKSDCVSVSACGRLCVWLIVGVCVCICVCVYVCVSVYVCVCVFVCG